MEFMDIMRPLLELQKATGQVYWNVSCDAGPQQQISVDFWVDKEVADMLMLGREMF